MVDLQPLSHRAIVRGLRTLTPHMQDNLKNLLVSVRIPCLPIEYYDKAFLMRVGAKIGRLIKIDEATSLVSRGHFARLCVEVDLDKPLISKFGLRRRVRRLEHEVIHLVCFSCGMFNHRKEECPLVQRTGNEDQEDRMDDTTGEDGNAQGKSLERKITPHINPEVTESYGPWMIARRRSRKSGRKDNSLYRKGKSEEGINRNQSRIRMVGSSSHFVVLRPED